VTYDVHTAPSAEEALEQLKETPFDIVLLDYKLPGMNGIELLGIIRDLNPDTHVVMMTAYASLETAVTATKKGAFDFLAKPFTPEELRAAVRAATRGSILLAQAKRMAEEKRRMRFEFLSVLSHELKAPIGAVEGYLELIRSGHVKDDATLQRVVERSLVRLTGMRKLIFDLLDLTRIEAGTRTRNLLANDIVDIAKGAVELVETVAADRGIAIDVSAEGGSRFVVDRSEIEIILNNLVSNAVKYNRDNGRVVIAISGTSCALTIRVSDTGIGLSKDECDRLFGEFVRIKNAKTRGIEGSGLGLSTIRKVARLYGGDAAVDSEPDVGTTFTITLHPEPAEVTRESN